MSIFSQGVNFSRFCLFKHSRDVIFQIVGFFLLYPYQVFIFACGYFRVWHITAKTTKINSREKKPWLQYLPLLPSPKHCLGERYCFNSCENHVTLDDRYSPQLAATLNLQCRSKAEGRLPQFLSDAVTFEVYWPCHTRGKIQRLGGCVWWRFATWLTFESMGRHCDRSSRPSRGKTD